MLKYIILGIIQGLTEFLPVSSSGHLVVLQRIFGMTNGQVATSVILHMGTLMSLCIFFFGDILALLRDLKSLLLIFIATFITGVIGICGKGFFEELFSSPEFVAFAWLVTGAVLILSKKFMQAKRHTVSLKDASMLGATQGLAIIPGLSRSGITISTLLFRGIDRETSFRFSFLASVPAIAGAAFVEAKDIHFIFQGDTKNFIIGFFCSLIVGLISLKFLRSIIHRSKFHYFGYYCIFAATITLILLR